MARFAGSQHETHATASSNSGTVSALAAEPAPFLAYALNGEPLTQGAPLRLIVPGWYGAPNVKWLSEIVAQHKATVIVLNHGTPIKSVEVKVDEAEWMPAKADPATTAEYGWKLSQFD